MYRYTCITHLFFYLCTHILMHALYTHIFLHCTHIYIICMHVYIYIYIDRSQATFHLNLLSAPLLTVSPSLLSVLRCQLTPLACFHFPDSSSCPLWFYLLLWSKNKNQTCVKVARLHWESLLSKDHELQCLNLIKSTLYKWRPPCFFFL